MLELFHPEVARRDCRTCQKWRFDDKVENGRWVFGDLYIWPRTGEPLERPPGIVVPCQTKLGCPKGAPDAGRELSEENRLAWQHYKECRAVGSFPDDPLVRENAVLIREIEDSRDRRDQFEIASLTALRAIT